MIDHAGIAQHVTSTAVKASPPIAVIVTAMAGVPWQTIVYILTAAYLVVQTGYGAWKWRNDWAAKRDRPKPTVPTDA